MAKSLTQLISATQTLLLDDGTRFSSATITAAARSALRDFNFAAPIFAGTLVDAVSDQLEYVLNASDFVNLIDVQDVLLQGTDSALDLNTSLPFDSYFEDTVPVIRLRSPQPTGRYLIIRFSLPHTINGLDSENVSNLPIYWDSTLTDGICFYSCLIRSTGRVETINLNQNVSTELQTTQAFYKQAFQYGLAQASRQRPPISQPSTSAWNDRWH